MVLDGFGGSGGSLGKDQGEAGNQDADGYYNNKGNQFFLGAGIRFAFFGRQFDFSWLKFCHGVSFRLPRRALLPSLYGSLFGVLRP